MFPQPATLASSTALMTTDLVPFEALRVLIVFDELCAYKRALRSLARVAHELGADLDVRPLPWHFDVLESDRWRALASSEAADCDIVIISTSRHAAISRTVCEWLQTNCIVRRDSVALLVAMLGPGRDNDVGGGAEATFLQGLAHKAGWSFLMPESAGSTRPQCAA